MAVSAMVLAACIAHYRLLTTLTLRSRGVGKRAVVLTTRFDCTLFRGPPACRHSMNCDLCFGRALLTEIGSRCRLCRRKVLRGSLLLLSRAPDQVPPRLELRAAPSSPPPPTARSPLRTHCSLQLAAHDTQHHTALLLTALWPAACTQHSPRTPARPFGSAVTAPATRTLACGVVRAAADGC